MLLLFKVVREALEQNRCVLSRAPLQADECVLGRARVPSLYAGRLSGADKSQLRDLVQVLVAYADDTKTLVQGSTDVAFRLQAFFGKCIAHADAGDESFLHAYFFLFWDKIRSEVSLGRELHLAPRWGSKEFRGPLSANISADEKAVADCLVRAGVEIDLYSYDARSETLALIELKRGESDDRAVGQLLRYYQAVWKLLPLSEFRKLNVNYVWPILVVSRIKEEHLQALPVHFRGLLDVLTFASRGDGAPDFTSFRRGAFTSRWM